MAGHHQFIDSLNPQFPNSSFGDTTLTKVFVGGLAWETQSRTLQRHFEQFGEILEAVVITDKNTGRSKGYGFVTFLDPESARQACVDPNPVIDGRRANCNLASQGRPRPAPPYGDRFFFHHKVEEALLPLLEIPIGNRTPFGVKGPMWPIRSFYGNAPGNQVAFVRNPMYHSSVPYGYQQGFPYPSYGYTSYGPEYFYPQMYGTPGTFTPPVYPIPQVGQQLPGPHGYAAVPVPSHQIIQLGGPSVNRVTAPPVPAVPAPFPPGVAAPALGSRSHFLIPAHSRQFSQGTSGSDQTS